MTKCKVITLCALCYVSPFRTEGVLRTAKSVHVGRNCHNQSSNSQENEQLVKQKGLSK